MVFWYLYRFDSGNEVVCGLWFVSGLVKGLRILVKILES